MDNSLSSRYARQTVFAGIGPAGQEHLAASRVAIVGVGALGTVLAAELARSGVGYLRLIDRDIVEPSNLQRQILFDELDAVNGVPKAAAAATKLAHANSSVELEAVVADVTWRNAESLLSDVDVILDGSDNFQIRYLINDVSVKHSVPWVYGGAVSSYGSTMFIRPGQTPCFVCMHGPDAGTAYDTCDTVGVISPIVSIIASLQVAETLKYLTGNINTLSNSIVHVDVWHNEYESLPLPPRNPDCPCCGKREFRLLDAGTDALTVSMCGRNTIQVHPNRGAVGLAALEDRLAMVATVQRTEHLLRVELEDVVMTMFADGRALIHGTDDPGRARSIYARYVGM